MKTQTILDPTTRDKLKRLVSFLILCCPSINLPPPWHILQTFAARLVSFIILCDQSAKIPPAEHVLKTFYKCLSTDNAIELLDYAQLHRMLHWLEANGLHESDLLTADEIKQIHNGGL